MRFEVIRGYVKHEGVLYRKGSFFEAEETELPHLINKGIAKPAPVPKSKKEKAAGDGDEL